MTAVADLAQLSQVLGRDPGEHDVTPLLHNAGNHVTAGIARYAGAGWSVVLKSITSAGTGAGHWAGSDRPDHWNYWAREPLAYRCGLPASAYEGTGLDAPRLLGAFDRPDGVDLWLEDVAGLAGERWDIDRLAECARRLGHGQGGYLAGRPLPDAGFLSRRWLRQYVDSKPVDGSMLDDEDAWRLPAIASAYAGLRPRLTRLWAERDSLLDTVEALPQTLCHLDVWPKNLVAAGERQVLLDWAFVGVGAVGEDAGNLVPDSVWDGFVPLSGLPELAERVWSGYLAGLREAGWTGDERLARLGFTAAGAVKYAWLAEHSIRRLRAGELTSYGGYSRLTVDELFNTYAGVLHLLLDWADEARRLAR
ncbi:MAG: hypothetical protein WCB04_05030 [Mycobacteriales bacterium]